MLSIVWFLITIPAALGFLCPACSDDLCRPVHADQCPGGLVLDNCDCCQTCAKTVNETCGGEYGLSGKCGKGLICVISPVHGAPLNDNQIGVCHECEESFEGCTVMDSVCVCDTSCTDIFEFADEQMCRNSLSYTANMTAPASNCSDVQCGVMFMPHCPHDSLPVKSTSLDSCCPGEPTCQCQMELCTRQTCAPGSDLTLIRGGLGTPGSCCDEFECSSQETSCHDVHCPLDELADEECPEDSYRLPDLVTSDGCCFIHQGCKCLPGNCESIECPPNMFKRVVAPALGQPSFCCEKYECVDEAAMSCKHEGEEFQHEETWKLDKCTTCTCRGGLMFCKVALCENQPRCDWMGTPAGECCPVCLGCMSAYGQLYANNETWFEDDYCTSCRCDRGQLHCIASSCMINCRNPRKIPGQCCPVCDEPDIVTLPPLCPSLTNCSLECDQGLLVDDTGCSLCQCKPIECPLHCPNGLLTDVDGQEVCECAPEVSRCPPIDKCYKQCPYGLKRSRDGCLRCKCNRCPPFTCKKKCPGDYARNEDGCKLCRCQGTEVHSSTSSSTPTSVIPIDTASRSCLSSNGRYFDNGESWNDGCRTCYCHGSKEMCVLLSCPVAQCSTPVILPGDCCPSCPDKPLETGLVVPPAGCQSVDGVFRVEGDVWYMDKCTQCLCHNGKVLCQTEGCPPLLCSHPVQQADKCCPQCPGDTDEILDPGVTLRSCVAHNATVFDHGDIWRVNPCQSCMCQYGQITCFSQVCPVLDCPQDKTVIRKGHCCPICSASRLDDVCAVDNVVYGLGEIWQQDVCTQCMCMSDGHISCTATLCHPVNCVNPVIPAGQCCAVCPGSSVSQGNDANEQLSSSIALIVVAGVAVLFVIVIIVLVIVLFRRKFQKRYRPRTENIATLVPETKRPKSTNLDLQGIMPLLVDNPNKHLSNNVYDGNSGEKRWSSEVEKNNTDNQSKDVLLKECDEKKYSHLQQV